MSVAKSRTFRSGNSEAIRLPKTVAFGRDVDVTIVRSGEVLTICPARAPLSALVDQLAALPRPLDVEVCDMDDLPERSNL